MRTRNLRPLTTLTLLLLFGTSALWDADAQSRRRQEKAQAQQIDATDPFAGLDEEFVERMAGFYEKNAIEKLYIMTDKPYYSAGEKIWFKGFLVDAATRQADTPSRYIYVELTDLRDSVWHRVKIIADEYGFHNCIELDPAMPPGDYTLRGYTRWMQNQDESFFFTKIIPVGNVIDDAVNPAITYSREEDGSILAVLTLTDMNRKPISQQRLVYDLEIDGKSSSSRARTDDNGELRIRFDPPVDEQAKNAIHIDINEETIFFDQRLYLPSFSDSFDIQFFPEGGHLLPLGAQAVAFKAVGTNGLGVEVTGNLYNEDGELVTSFASVHRGMGRFTFTPQPGGRYYAEAVSAEGRNVRAELPAVAPAGATLGVAQQGGHLLCQTKVAQGIDLSRLILAVQGQGEVLVTGAVTEREAMMRIPHARLLPGIAQVTLLDTLTKQVLAQRLLFVPDAEPATARIAAPADNFGRRQKVTLDITAAGVDGKPLAGDFALVVTDRNNVRQDSLAGTIVSELLLTSDLQGYVEDPGYYFLDDAPERAYYLDLLMMTQGWRRYDIADLLYDRIPEPLYPAEWSQGLSGEIIGALGLGVKKPVLTIASFGGDFLVSYELPERKEFTVSGLYFPDSTALFLQAANDKKWKRGVEVRVNPEEFPFASSLKKPQPHFSEIESVIPGNFLDNAKNSYYDEGGTRVINIDGVHVIARKKFEERERAKNFRGINVNRVLVEDDLNEYRGRALTDVLHRFSLSVRREANNDEYHLHDIMGRIVPLMIIDGMHYDISENLTPLSILRAGEIKRVGYLRAEDPAVAIYGFRGTTLRNDDSSEQPGPTSRPMPSAGGVLFVDMNRERNIDIPNTSQMLVSPLGYKKPETLYQPKYEVAEELRSRKPDRRTTLCWEPRLRTDTNGKAQVSFYTADAETQYDIILEGISDDGRICRQTSVIERTK